MSRYYGHWAHQLELHDMAEERHPNSSKIDWVVQPQDTWRVLLLVLTSFIIFFTILGNTLTLFAVFRMKPMQSSVSNLYIASLAAADLIVGGFVMFFMMLYNVAFENRWVLGPIFCDIWQAVDFISITISLYSICSIGFDRWWNLEKPLRVFKRNKTLAKRMIILVWTIPVLIWVPVMVGLRALNGGPEEGKCNFVWKPQFLVPAIAVPFLYLPVLILIALFVRITFVIRSHLGFLYRHSNRNFNFQMSSTGGRTFDRLSRSPSPNPSHSPRRKLSVDTTANFLAPPSVDRVQLRRKSSPMGAMGRDMSAIIAQNEMKRNSITHSPLAMRVMRERLETLKETRSSIESSSLHNAATFQISPPTSNRPSLTRVTKKFVPGSPVPQENTPLLPKGQIELADKKKIVNLRPKNSEKLISQSLNQISESPDVLSLTGSQSSNKRTSVTSDTAVVFTRLFERREKERPHELFRANTENTLDTAQPKPRHAARFSIISIASNLFGSRCDSLNIFSDISTPGVSQQIRAAKAVGVILLFFLLCWLPFLVLWPLKAYCPDCVSDTVYNLSIWANYLNSTLNPILYTLCSPRVQGALKSYCRCLTEKRDIITKTPTFV